MMVPGTDMPPAGGSTACEEEAARPAARLALGLFGLARGAAVGVALVVAVAGLLWGLPNRQHNQSYHPDEQNITYSLRNMDPARGDFNPRFFGNPTFYTYQVGALAFAASRAGILPREMSGEYWLAHPEAVRRFYLMGRMLSFVYAMLSALIVYFIARKVMAGRVAPATAAMVFLALPVTAVHSHYMTVNAAGVFWSLAALLFALKVQDLPSWRNYVLAGALAGLAISTKLNNLFLPLGILAAHLTLKAAAPWWKRAASGKLALAAAACATAFFLGSPYYLLSPASVSADEHNRMNVGALIGFTTPLWRMLGDFWNHLAAACGWGLAAALLAALPAAFFLKGLRRLAPILAVATPFLLVAVKSGWWAFPSRMWPLIALLVILAAAAWQELCASRRVVAATAALGLGILATIPWNFAYLNLMKGPHVREESSRWIIETVPPESAIVILDTPYFEDPNIIYMNALHPELVDGPHYDIINLEGDFDALSPAAGQWLVVPSYLVEKIEARERMSLDDYALAHGFRRARTFRREFKALGVELRPWAPADMAQNNPVYVFRRG